MALIATVIVAMATPVQSEGQGMGWGTAGFVAGTVTGGWGTLGAIVARARLGSYTFDLGDVRIVSPETLPALTFPVAGAWLGATSSDRLVSAAAGAGIGFVGGGLLGLGLGSWISDDPEGRWAGAIMGSATGVLVGVVVGGLQAPSDDASGPGSSEGSMPIVLSIPLGVSR